jgi:hypothetical protein
VREECDQELGERGGIVGAAPLPAGRAGLHGRNLTQGVGLLSDLRYREFANGLEVSGALVLCREVGVGSGVADQREAQCRREDGGRARLQVENS